MPKSMSFERAGKTFIAVHGLRNASPGDWNAFLSALEARAHGGPRATRVQRGASIDIKEREQLERLLTQGRLRVAVLTDSKSLRGAATALSWFKIPIKTFAVTEVEPALDHLRVEKGERARVYTTLAQLKAQVLN
jgi:hypothetical protein